MATERLEIEVEIASCVLEKVVAVPVERRSQDVEIPLVVKNPTVLMAVVKLYTVLEFVAPIRQISSMTSLLNLVLNASTEVLRAPAAVEKLVDV